MMLHEVIRGIVNDQRAKAAADTLTREEFLHNCRLLLDMASAVEFLERHGIGTGEPDAADLASGKVLLFPAKPEPRNHRRRN